MRVALTPEDPMEASFEEIWREHRRYLLDIAYRMLGSIGEAEDIVQEAFARLLAVDVAEIEDVRGWLVVVVGRLCIDHLRSARVRRQAYVGPWLPEPVVEPPAGAVDPAERVTLDDSVRMALLVVLERLSPAERAAFVLHDVFQFSFEDIGAIVGRSPEACRQLASRARRHVADQTGPARFEANHTELAKIADRFIAASTSGDLDALMDVLDPEVAGWTDSGGRPGAPQKPIVGAEKVARQFLWFMETFGIRLSTIPINGEPGVVAYQGDHVVSVLAFETRDGAITRIHGIANPDKLAYVASVLEGR
jgi:RNA polymerase sigma-70 factor (ECF subfamily)